VKYKSFGIDKLIMVFFAQGFVLAETFSYILNDIISPYFTIYIILFSSIYSPILAYFI